MGRNDLAPTRDLMVRWNAGLYGVMAQEDDDDNRRENSSDVDGVLRSKIQYSSKYSRQDGWQKRDIGSVTFGSRKGLLFPVPPGDPSHTRKLVLRDLVHLSLLRIKILY